MDSRSRIGQVSIRSRIAETSASERWRLQRAWHELTADALDRALDAAGLPPDEMICVRQLDLQMRLWCGQTDEAMVGEWALAVARALRHEIDAGHSNVVVRFRSTLHGVVDAVRGLVRGSTTRAWAWRQLDLPVDGPVRDAVVRTLLREPALTVAALTILGEDAAFVDWAPRIPDDAWEAIATSALGASGRARYQAFAGDDDHVVLEARDAARILARSTFDRLAARVAPGRSVAVRDAVALLVVLAGEPSRLDRGASYAAAIVAAIARLLPGGDRRTLPAARAGDDIPGGERARDVLGPPPAPRVGDDSPGRERVREPLEPPRAPMTSTPHARERSEPQAPGSHDTNVDGRPFHDAPAPPKDSTEPGLPSRAAAGNDRAASPDREISQAAGGADAREAQSARGDSPARDAASGETPSRDADDFEQGPLDLRRRAWTEWGGLLFLLHVVGDTAVCARAMDEASLRAHSLAWTLHRIGMLIVPCEPRDPAVLAFAGLLPDADPPEEGEPSADASATLLDLAQAIRVAAVERLATELDTADLFSVCARQAEIVADPGWFDVRFPIDAVSLAVRRAGLDLDPDYVPWLGVVVRFTYV